VAQRRHDRQEGDQAGHPGHDRGEAPHHVHGSSLPLLVAF